MRRKSAAEKKAIGTYRPGRDKETPQFVSADGLKAPAYVRRNKIAHGEWKAVAPFLEAEGILKQTDISLLASYCILYSRWREAALDVENNGQTLTVTSTTRTGMTQKPITNPAVRNELLYQAGMMKTAIKFGLNPLDRPRVEVSPFEDEDDVPTEDDGDDDYLNVPIR